MCYHKRFNTLLIYKYTYTKNKVRIAKLKTDINVCTLLQLRFVQNLIPLIECEPRHLIFKLCVYLQYLKNMQLYRVGQKNAHKT